MLIGAGFGGAIGAVAGRFRDTAKVIGGKWVENKKAYDPTHSKLIKTIKSSTRTPNKNSLEGPLDGKKYVDNKTKKPYDFRDPQSTQQHINTDDKKNTPRSFKK